MFFKILLVVIILKIKIPEIINDYYEEFLKYYKIIKKEIKRVFRKLRYHWHNPRSKIGIKVISFINLIVLKAKEIIASFKPYYNLFKDNLLASENRKRNLTVIGSFLVINLLLLILPSFAIYQNQFDFSMLGGIVGDKYANQFDYTLQIYVEKVNSVGEGSGTYNLTSDIPTLGYTFSSYNCKNNSILTFNEDTNNTSVTLDKKDFCQVYFDLIGTSDITLKIMLEDEVDANTYSLSDNIPYYGYKYSHYECDNNSTLTYDSNLHKAKIDANNSDFCTIYFQKEPFDLEVLLYLENTNGSYIESNSIKSGNNYVLNESSSECLNNNDERIETNISYTDGYIEITSSEVAYCKVYLDLENE